MIDLAADWAAGDWAAGDLAKGLAALAEGSSGSAPRLQQAEGLLPGCWGLPLQGLLSQVRAGAGSQLGLNWVEGGTCQLPAGSLWLGMCCRLRGSPSPGKQ